MRPALAILLLAGLGPRAAGGQSLPSWRWSAGLGLRVQGKAGEIGRQANATGGHEDLVARLGPSLHLVFGAGYQSRYGGAEFRVAWSGRSIEVRNDEGMTFPRHGGPPLAWTGSLLGYPLAAVVPGARVQPFLSIGGGGLLLQVDLDNVKGQTLYHSFQWTVAGGLRFMGAGPGNGFRPPLFLELRGDRQQVRANGPLHQLTLWGAAVSLGMAF